MASEKAQINIRVSDRVYNLFRIICEVEGRSTSTVGEEAFELLIEQKQNDAEFQALQEAWVREQRKLLRSLRA